MLNFSDVFIPRFPSIGAEESFDGSPGKERPKKNCPEIMNDFGHLSFSAERARSSNKGLRMIWCANFFIMKYPMWKWVCLMKFHVITRCYTWKMVASTCEKHFLKSNLKQIYSTHLQKPLKLLHLRCMSKQLVIRMKKPSPTPAFQGSVLLQPQIWNLHLIFQPACLYCKKIEGFYTD